ncbi:MAG: outer membrane beta-barrel protein [Kiritimatiellia bacterium]
MTGVSRILRLVPAFLLITGFYEVRGEQSGPVSFKVDLRADITDNRDSDTREESNLDFYVEPRADFSLRGGPFAGNIFYAPAYRYRTDPSATQNESQLFHDLGVKLSRAVNQNLQFKLDEHFSYTDDPSVQEGGTTLRRDSSFVLNRAQLDAIYKVSRRLTMKVDGAHRIKRYDDDERALESDEDSLSGGLSLWGHPRRKVRLTALVRGGDYNYDSSQGIERGFVSLMGALGLDRAVSRNSLASVQAGMTALNYADSSLGTEGAPFVSLSLETETGRKTSISAFGKYELRDSDVYPFASQANASAGVGVDWKVGRSLSFGASGKYSLGRYEEDYAPASAPDSAYSQGVKSGDEKTITASVRAAYRFSRRNSLKLTQRLEDVDSDVDVSFTRNDTVLAFSTEF